MKNTKWISLTNLFKDGFKTEAMVTLANSLELPALGKRLGSRLLSACCPNLVKFTSRLRQLNNFFQYLLRMTKNHGATYTVKYLKASQLALQKKIAGTPFQSLSEIEPELPLPRLATCGLPKVIPRRDRQAILSGSPSIIRWWLTIFSVYRVIAIPGKMKLNTITDMYTGDPAYLELVSDRLAVLTASLAKKNSWVYGTREAYLLPLETSSPSNTVSWLGWALDPVALRLHGLHHTILGWMAEMKMHDLRKQFLNCLSTADALGIEPWQCSNKATYAQDSHGNDLKVVAVGQLSCKEEAAGKIRVFAMVDIWTQSVLKPLHQFLFSILKSIPNDATFDQDAAVKRCFAKAKRSGKSFGYDLSAATDRLPIQLQVGILSSLIGKGAARLWAELLVGRDYYLNHRNGQVMETDSFRYSVGQPMGALSSWAMLALTHHLLVQYACSRVRKGTFSWYEGYELLGDDIVIFDEDVAASYLSVMERLGVGINLAKSVVSVTDAFEFAKVTGYHGSNVSAISWKMFISQNTAMGRANIAYYLLNRGICQKHMVRWLRNICRKTKYEEGDWNFSLFALFSMFANSGKISLESVIQASYDLSKPARGWYKGVWLSLRVQYIELLVRSMAVGETPVVDNSSRLKTIWDFDAPFAAFSLFTPVRNFAKDWDSEAMVTELAERMVRANYPADMVHVCTYNRIFRVNGDWDDKDIMLNDIYLVYFENILCSFDKLSWPFINWDDSRVDSPLSEIVDLRSDMDRILELAALVDRMKAKIAGVAPAAPRLVSPLKMLKFLGRLRRDQIGWVAEIKRDFMTR